MADLATPHKGFPVGAVAFHHKALEKVPGLIQIVGVNGDVGFIGVAVLKGDKDSTGHLEFDGGHR